MSLQRQTLYAFVNTATGFVFPTTETLSISEPRHWTELNYHRTLGGRYFNIFANIVSFSKVPGRENAYFIHPSNCEDKREGLKYMSSREDWVHTGTYCGLYDRYPNAPYSWENFEFEAISFDEYNRRYYYTMSGNIYVLEYNHIHVLQFPSVRQSVSPSVCSHLTFYLKELRSCNMT